MSDHRIFQRLQHQLCGTRSFHVTRHDAGRQRVVSGSRLVESILNAVANRPESNTRVIAYHVSELVHGSALDSDEDLVARISEVAARVREMMDIHEYVH
ncbi:hypothetical protein TNCV_4290571 [Trichonephila clavipes]|nr:hypothetical protein TNCV_4290571 [Trichonephila clavipes]